MFYVCKQMFGLLIEFILNIFILLNSYNSSLIR